jgi:hypothetical protein
LPLDELLLGSRKRPVGLAVAHAGFATAIHEVPIGHI